MTFPFRFSKAALSALLPFLPPLLIGLFLRLDGLPGQILLDDEWHSLNYVLDKSFWTLLVSQGHGANSIPLNLLNRLLLLTPGWSEFTLRLPHLLCAAAGLLVFPRLVARLAGRPTALLFAWLFALSPCLTFYSRIVRPYSAVLFFGFLALLNLALWIREGRPRQRTAYALCGVIAVYFHLYAALPVFAPLGLLFLLSWAPRPAGSTPPQLNPWRLLATGAAMALALVLLVGPATWNNPWWVDVLGGSGVTRRTLWELLSLLAGTRLAPFKLAFAALAAYGLQTALRRDWRTGAVWLAAGAAFLLLVAFGTQQGLHSALVLARFNLIFFPVVLLLAAAGLAALLEALPPAVPVRLRTPLGVALVAALLAGSPVWRTHARPNNFMHHSAFQDSYQRPDPRTSRPNALTPLPTMPRERIHPLYAQLAADPAIPGLIEYPLYLGDPANLHWFTQQTHRKPVAIGYVPDLYFPTATRKNENIFQDTPLDYILSRARTLGWDPAMRFANVVPIDHAARLRQTHPGWILVVHRDILAETLAISLSPPGENFAPNFLLLLDLQAKYGPPFFSDSQLLAWRIP
jgi:hypothetical protein